MTNNRIKILAISFFITLVAIMLSFAPNFSTNAEGDGFIKEIADYKTWTKINKEPIKATNQIDGTAAKESSFIIDGQEIVNFQIDGQFG